MKTYEVTIKAKIIKTITVEATDEQEAEELAHSEFTVACDGDDELYTQETINTKEAT